MIFLSSSPLFISLLLFPKSTYPSCVLPIPGAPQNSVIFPIGIPFPIIASIWLEPVRIEPCVVSFWSISSAETSEMKGE